MLQSLDPRRLLVLDAVLREGTLAAAAHALSLTPSAVSQQIAALERESGAILLERTKHGVRVTDAGALLAAHAGAIRNEVDRATADLIALREEEHGALRVGIFASAGLRLLPDALKRFSASHPRVVVTVLELDGEDALRALRVGQLDIAVIHAYSLALDPVPEGLVARVFGEDPLLLIVPSRMPRPRDLAELHSARWIGPSSDPCRQTLLQACRRAGFEPDVQSICADYRLAEQLVAAGLGVALAPELALDPDPPAGVVRIPLAEAGTRRLISLRIAATARASRADALTAELETSVALSVHLGRPHARP